jgi:hypothetical protein
MATMNVTPTMSINELRTFIPLVAEDITPIIVSEPGVGKTSLLSMIALDNGDKWQKVGDNYPDDKYDYIYVDCPVKDMQDIGMTVPNHASKTLEYYVGEVFKMDSPKPKIILLDEFMKAPKLLQIIFTRLMLERCVGDRPLTKGSKVFGTSNNASDGVGDTMLAHAGNRVCIVKMAKPTPFEWLEWASNNGISRITRAWVALYPRCLRSYTEGDQEDNPYIFKPKMTSLSFCSPRSLAKADKALIQNRDLMTENSLLVALAGTIGASAANDMSAFLSMEKSLVDIKDILKSPTSIKVPDEISAQVMIIFQAVDMLSTQDELTKFMEFVNRIPSSEVQAIFFTMMMRNAKSMKIARNNAQISEWARLNHEMF